MTGPGFHDFGYGKEVAPEKAWERRVMEQHLLLSEYGAGGVWLYEKAPRREYRAHLAVLQGKAEKESEETEKAKREAKQAS